MTARELQRQIDAFHVLEGRTDASPVEALRVMLMTLLVHAADVQAEAEQAKSRRGES